MKTIKLFNAVCDDGSRGQPYVDERGYIIESGAMWAKKNIDSFYKKEKLDGYGLNKTFHKSWFKILTASRNELMIEQIRHYLSTYGSGYQDEMYIPAEVLELPEQEIKFKVVRALPANELQIKCLALLQSGIALQEETINDILSVLTDELAYRFIGDEQIRNKEAIVKIADLYGILPNDLHEFFRYIVYRSTGQSLLIKSKSVIDAIKATSYNPAIQFEKFGLERLAEIFNRFKPLFLAFKNRCPATINRIAKLSKKVHRPMPANPLNFATSQLLLDRDRHWLHHATPFALFRALAALHARMEGQDIFTYRIRNGKSFVKPNKPSSVAQANFHFLMDFCRARFDLRGKKIFLPENVEYALPTSEKMFAGNIPAGTRFTGESLAIGIYWENAWGSYDMDLSALNIGGKIGWNAAYKQGQGELIYSGDITDAPFGAVEYMYAGNGLSEPTLILNNIFSGRNDSSYKIIIGQGDHIDYQYMMNPALRMLETRCQSVQRQNVLGILLPMENKQCFVILNFGAGASRVSGNSEVTLNATKALFQQWNNPLTLRTMLSHLGATITTDTSDATIDLSLEKLEKDSFLRLFL